MFNLMRTHQRWLMVLITLLTIVAFIFLYNTTQLEQLPSDAILRVYGKDYSITDIQRIGRKFPLALGLGLTQYANTLDRTSGMEGGLDFVINTIILENEGKRLGIVPTEQQIKDAITSLPAFQTGGQFDPAKYNRVLSENLGPRGFTMADIEDMVRNWLVLQRVEAILDTVPTASPVEVEFQDRAFRPATGVAVVFNRADYLDQVKITDQDIEAFYTVGQDNYVTPEKRTVRYVRFALPAEAKNLEQKEKLAEQQKIADAADQFVEAAVKTSFDKAASDAGLIVQTSLPFDSAGNVDNPQGLSPQDLQEISGPVHAIAAPAFTLSENNPVSSVIQDGDDFLVIDLASVTPAEQQTLEQARPQIVEELKETFSQAKLEEAADAALEKIREAMKAGKTFAEAAAEAGVKTEPFTDVAPLDDQASPESRAFADAATTVKEGEISGFVPTETGGFVVWLEKRAPADEKAFAERRDQIEDFVVARKQSILLYEWLRGSAEAAGLSLATEG